MDNEFYQRLLSNEYTVPSKVNNVLATLKEEVVYNSQHIAYVNMPVSFDIETTNFSERSENEESQKATMYVWQMCLDGFYVIGRTWKEFLNLIRCLEHFFQTNEKKRLIIYVHNLAFEFSFIAKLFPWIKVFSDTPRRPIYALTYSGIEFRCSYRLSGYSLAKVGENLITYKCKKMVGDLDYSLPRHCLTPLTLEEIGYSIGDVRVVCAYIKEKMEAEKNGIAGIPLTKTGYVRRLIKNRCLPQKDFARLRYFDLIHSMNLTVEEYTLLRATFAGGFTHANAFYVGQEIEDVDSLDETSAYPTVEVSEPRFPMSSGVRFDKIDEKIYQKLISKYCVVAWITFYNICDTFVCDNYISFSKCVRDCKNVQRNNGRVVCADEITLGITEVDYDIIKKTYEWDRMDIHFGYYYPCGYLPKPLIESVLELYEKKTTLKGVDGKEAEYMNGKENLNANYGMMVMNIVRDEVEYTGDSEQPWDTIKGNAELQLEKYNKNAGRFLYYPWGIYITAYARRNLWSAILECGNDFKYADTDSVKITNYQKHKAFFDNYNNEIQEKIKKCLEFHNIPVEKAFPKNKFGEAKPLGVWELETEKENYKRFKTLGAKRYLVEYQSGKMALTVSGVNKSKAMDYLQNIKGYDNDTIFNLFDFGKFDLPPGASGKLSVTYIDSPIEGYIKDYQGALAPYSEQTASAITPAPYSMKMTESVHEYLDYIQSLEFYK